MIGSSLHAGSFTVENSATGGLYEPFIAVHSTLTFTGEAHFNAPLVYPNPVSGILQLKTWFPETAGMKYGTPAGEGSKRDACPVTNHWMQVSLRPDGIF